MLFVIYQMFVIRKIAKNGITCSKQNELPVVILEIVTKNSIPTESSLFVILYNLLFVIWDYLLFVIRYLVLFAIPCSLFGITCSNYKNNE